MELWEVIARESIRDLASRYNSNGDAGRFEQVLELFAPDAVMDLGDRVYTGHDEILTIFTGVRDHLGDASGSTAERPPYVRHYGATHQIDIIDETSASGRLYYAVICPHGLDHWGRYIDRYRVVDGQWRFAHRRVTTDGRSKNSLFPQRS